MSKGFINVYERDNGAILTSFPGGASLPGDGGYKVVHYEENGKDIYQDWLDSLRDIKGRIAVQRATDRIRQGNLGKHHFCRDGVWELTIDYGPGYRVYYSTVGSVVVLLLCAGSKRTQDKDIENAVMYLRRYKEAHSL